MCRLPPRGGRVSIRLDTADLSSIPLSHPSLILRSLCVTIIISAHGTRDADAAGSQKKKKYDPTVGEEGGKEILSYSLPHEAHCHSLEVRLEGKKKKGNSAKDSVKFTQA
eukprot:gene3927-2795_t